MLTKAYSYLGLERFQQRRDEEELMDLPTISRKDFIEALHDILWVNQNLGGTAAMLSELGQLLPSDLRRPLSILDLGTGAADIPRAIVRWARQHNNMPIMGLQITAVDIHPVAIELAQQMGQSYPEIQLVQGDALQLDYPDGSFDLVISSMFMHHLQMEEAVHLLREMARISRLGLVVNDLERHPLAWLGIKLLGFVQGRGKIFQNDAPLSVLRGFTRTELENLKQAAGLAELQIKHRRPYRWLLSWKKDNAPFITPHYLQGCTVSNN